MLVELSQSQIQSRISGQIIQCSMCISSTTFVSDLLVFRLILSGDAVFALEYNISVVLNVFVFLFLSLCTLNTFSPKRNIQISTHCSLPLRFFLFASIVDFSFGTHIIWLDGWLPGCFSHEFCKIFSHFKMSFPLNATRHSIFTVCRMFFFPNVCFFFSIVRVALDVCIYAVY